MFYMFQPFYYKFTPEKQKDGYSVGILSSWAVMLETLQMRNHLPL